VDGIWWTEYLYIIYNILIEKASGKMGKTVAVGEKQLNRRCT
jgi:hypothetical protein